MYVRMWKGVFARLDCIPYIFRFLIQQHPLGEMWFRLDGKEKTFPHSPHTLIPYFSLFGLWSLWMRFIKNLFVLLFIKSKGVYLRRAHRE